MGEEHGGEKAERWLGSLSRHSCIWCIMCRGTVWKLTGWDLWGYTGAMVTSVCVCFVSIAEARGWERAHHALLSPRAGWLMKHSSYHAALVVYREDGNAAPSLARTPTAPSLSSHPQSWHTAKQYVWQWLSHEHKPSNQLRINIFFHYIPCNPEGKKGIETNFPLCLVLYSA